MTEKNHEHREPTNTLTPENNQENREGYQQETPENARIVKWTQEIIQFIDEVTQNGLSFTPKKAHIHNRNMTQRKTRSKKWYKFSTQSIRREIARGLGEFYETSLCFAQSPELTLAEREKWGRLTAYTAQTINAITTTYDDVRIEATLHELKQFVKTLQQ